jgi:L-seryl-tRNA(Ser) seleniumtransferase
MLAALPGVGALAPASLAQQAVAEPAASGGDIFKELGVRTFINAGGTFTMLSGSLMLPEVVEAIRRASKSFAKLDDVHAAVGRKIAERLGCEAALVTAGCASALSLATAACVAGSDPKKIARIPDIAGMKDEVIVQKTHRVGYDHAIRNAGVKLIEVETRDQLESAINERTAMMFFLNFAAPKGAVGREEFIAIGKKHDVPTLLDAAADVPPAENLWKYTKMGFDLVGFSGGKGLRGPQSAGLLLGRKDLIAAAKLNTSPHGDTLCRSNKVNKEEIIGMWVALDSYLKRDHEADWREWENRCATITKCLSSFKDVRTEVTVPEIANAVPHLRIAWDEKARGLTVAKVVEKLRDGEPSIEVGPGPGRRQLTIGVWMMEPGEDRIVGERLRTILAGA